MALEIPLDDEDAGRPMLRALLAGARIDGYLDAEGALHFIAPMDGTLIVPTPPSECPWTSADECAMVQERMAGVDPWGIAFPCREHGGWCEVCEEFRAVIVPARFVDARICEDCAATEPNPEEEVS